MPIKFNLNLTPDRLRDVLDYDPKTGMFTRKCDKGPFKKGQMAGSMTSRGRKTICIDGKLYLSSRLAWLYVHGQWPKEEIDHINRDILDDRISNLREATRRQNCMNRRAMNGPRRGTGEWGIRLHGGKWEVRVLVNGKFTTIGRFYELDEARAVAAETRRKIQGKFAPKRVGAKKGIANGLRSCNLPDTTPSRG